jgi:hypothetical protein
MASKMLYRLTHDSSTYQFSTHTDSRCAAPDAARNRSRSGDRGPWLFLRDYFDRRVAVCFPWLVGQNQARDRRGCRSWACYEPIIQSLFLCDYSFACRLVSRQSAPIQFDQLSSPNSRLRMNMAFPLLSWNSRLQGIAAWGYGCHQTLAQGVLASTLVVDFLDL